MANTHEGLRAKDIIHMRTNEGLVAKVDVNGAYLESLTTPGGLELLFPRTLINDKDRGGVPVCAPIFGPGGIVGLNQHGFARNLTWEPSEQQNESHLTLFLKNPRLQDPSIPEAYEGCEMNLSIEIDDGSASSKLSMILNVANRGTSPFTLSPGFHPYFPASKGPSINVTQSGVAIPYVYDKTRIETADILPPPISRESVQFNNDTHAVRIGSLGLPRTVVWTDSPDDYFCVEPTAAGPATTDSSAENIELLLQPGDTKRFEMSIQWSSAQAS